MKEKRKGNPRRRIIWLLGAMVFLLGGYFSLPYAQDAFVAWWEDDPFTPLCDIPEYALTTHYQYSYSNRLYPLRSNAEPEDLGFLDFGWNVSPNGRWYFGDYNEAGLSVFRDSLTHQTVYQFYAKDQWDFSWLYDNRLLHADITRRQSQIYDPERNSLEVLAQSHDVQDVRLLSHQPLVNHYYFLAVETIPRAGGALKELVAYDMERNRRVFHRVHTSLGDNTYVLGTFSPDGRYYAYYHEIVENNIITSRGIWLLDMETGVNEKVLDTKSESTSLVWSPDSRYFASYFPSYTAAMSIVDVQGAVFSYSSSADTVEMLGWNQDGFWVYESDMDNFANNRLSWGSFDGSTITLSTIMEGRIDKGFLIRGSNNVFITESNGRDEATSYVVNPNGEIEHRLSNSVSTYFARLSPDSRYIAYRSSTNEWHYVLDLESGHVCRAFELETDRVFYVSWYAYPQS